MLLPCLSQTLSLALCLIVSIHHSIHLKKELSFAMTTILPRVKIDPRPNDIIPDDTPIEMLKPDYDETLMDDTQIIEDRKRKQGGRKGPRACHKHGLVDCTLDRCPLPKGYGYVALKASWNSNNGTRIWFSSDRIARMYCCICGKAGDHWDYLCSKDDEMCPGQKAAEGVSKKPREGGPQTRSMTRREGVLSGSNKHNMDVDVAPSLNQKHTLTVL